MSSVVGMRSQIAKRWTIIALFVFLASTLYFINVSSSIYGASKELPLNDYKGFQQPHSNPKTGHVIMPGLDAEAPADGAADGAEPEPEKQIQQEEPEKSLQEVQQEEQKQHQEEIEKIEKVEEAEEKKKPHAGDSAAGASGAGDDDDTEAVNKVRYISEAVLTHISDTSKEGEINWQRYAYVQYATDLDYACNAILNFKKLRQFGSKADLVMLTTVEALLQAPQAIKDQISSIGILAKTVPRLKYSGAEETWDQGYTKFHIFELTDYERVVYFDSDSTALSNMDELFFLPENVDVAMPLAYDDTWHRMKESFKEYASEKELDDKVPQCFVKTDSERTDYDSSIISNALVAHKGAMKEKDNENDSNNDKPRDIRQYTSHIYQRLPHLNEVLLDTYYFSDHFMVVKPNDDIYKDLLTLCDNRKDNEYDMDIVNKLLRPKIAQESGIYEVIVLPHNVYGTLSGSIRTQNYDILDADPTEIECYARKSYEHEKSKDSTKEEAGKPEKPDEKQAEEQKEAVESKPDEKKAPAEGSDKEKESVESEKGKEAPSEEASENDDDVPAYKPEKSEQGETLGKPAEEGETKKVESSPEDAASEGGLAKVEEGELPNTPQHEDVNPNDFFINPLEELEGAEGGAKAKREGAGTDEARKVNEAKSEKVKAAIKMVHYSDFPIPKPWVSKDHGRDYIGSLILCPDDTAALQEYDDADQKPRIVSDCSATKFWNGLYSTFATERQEVCGLGLVTIVKK